MANNLVLLDTSGWIALLNTGRQRFVAVVTDWIIAETGNGLARTTARDDVQDASQRMLSSPHAIVQFVEESLLLDACKLYHERQDKHWGLVDCASFVVMRQRAAFSWFCRTIIISNRPGSLAC